MTFTQGCEAGKVSEYTHLAVGGEHMCPSLRERILMRQATVAYYLMSDNRRRMPSDAYLRAELTEAHDPGHAHPSGAASHTDRPQVCGRPCITFQACVTKVGLIKKRGSELAELKWG